MTYMACTLRLYTFPSSKWLLHSTPNVLVERCTWNYKAVKSHYKLGFFVLQYNVHDVNNFHTKTMVLNAHLNCIDWLFSCSNYDAIKILNQWCTIRSCFLVVIWHIFIPVLLSLDCFCFKLSISRKYTEKFDISSGSQNRQLNKI